MDNKSADHLNSNLDFSFVCIPEIFNVLVLSVVLYQFYKSIEISHPIYFMLFGNLFAAFVSSVTNFCLMLIPGRNGSSNTETLADDPVTFIEAFQHLICMLLNKLATY